MTHKFWYTVGLEYSRFCVNLAAIGSIWRYSQIAKIKCCLCQVHQEINSYTTRVAQCRCRSHKELEFFGWKRNSKNTRSRIFRPTPTPEVQLNHFFTSHCFFGNSGWNGTIYFETFIETENTCSMYHDFHWLLVATKLLTAKLHSCYVKGAGVEYFTSDSTTLPTTNFVPIK